MSIENVHDLVVRGKAKLVPAAVQETLDEGVEASKILDTMIEAMDVVGENFKNGVIFVPEMLIAAKAMKKGVEVLKPHLASGAAGALGKVIIGTVAGDLHDIGKNLVAMMIESAGFEVIDLGVDVPDRLRGEPRYQDRCLLRPADHHHARSAADRCRSERRFLAR